MIKYLRNSEINFIRWDNCINNSINGNIFAYSWYLNILCENWDALILGDYEYVMPLLNKTKYKKEIIFASQFGIHLGIYTNQLLSDKIIKKFINSIPTHFYVINLFLNKYNKISDYRTKVYYTNELDLIQPYSKISSKYSSDFKEKILLANTNKVTVINGLLPNDLINFSLRKDAIKNPKLNKNDIQVLRMIMAQGLRYSLGEVHGAYTEENNLCGVAYFLKSKNNVYLLFSSMDKQGLKSNALHLLIDNYIRLNSEKKLTLNLDNLVSKNNEHFFNGIGSKKYKYRQYYVNKLPWIYKLFIKNYEHG